MKGNSAEQVIIGCDIGLSGGISDGENNILMPTKKVLLKEARYKFARDKSGNKVTIKTGEDKGKFKMKVLTPAKYKKELDVLEIKEFFYGADIIALEEQGTTRGNAANTSKTTSINFGKLLALAELSGAKVVRIPANKWKKYFNLSEDKLLSVIKAEQVTGEDFRTERGALLDGPAEAVLIRLYIIENIKDYNDDTDIT